MPQSLTQKKTRLEDARKTRRHVLWLAAVWAFGCGTVVSCLVSQTNLECRPCDTKGTCGTTAFECVDGTCRPRGIVPTEFLRCESTSRPDAGVGYDD